MESSQVDRISRNPEFQQLVRTRRAFGWLLTIAMLVIYYGYVLLVAYQKPLIARPLFGSVTVGIVLGLGVIVSAIVLTGIYVLRANTTFDAMSRRIVETNLRARSAPGTAGPRLEGVR